MDNLIFAFNSIMPILLLILLGYILARKGFLTEAFLKNGYKLVFNVALPVLLFVNVYEIESFGAIDFSFVWYSCIAVIAAFLIGLLIVKLFIPVRKQKGVVLQCIFRSNYAIIGIPLAELLGGHEARGAAAVLSAVAIPLFNVLAVISLSIFVSGEDGKGKTSKGKLIGDVLKKIAKNPLIIAVLLGLLALLLRSVIPVNEGGELVFSLKGSLPFLYSALKSVSVLATPLALIVLGGNFDFSATGEALKAIIIGTAMRIAIVPFVSIGAAVLLSKYTNIVSFDSTVYPAFVALFSTPVAVSSAIMAEQMDNDGKLAGQLVVWTSLFSIVTIFIAVVILRSLGLL